MLVGAVGIEITLSSVLKDLRNILRNRKKQLSSVGNAYCCPKAASFFSSRLPHRQQHFPVCFPHRLWDRLRVDVNGCPNVSVAQQFLLHLHVHTKRSEKSRIRVTKCVPTDAPDQARYRPINRCRSLSETGTKGRLSFTSEGLLIRQADCFRVARPESMASAEITSYKPT